MRPIEEILVTAYLLDKSPNKGGVDDTLYNNILFFLKSRGNINLLGYEFTAKDGIVTSENHKIMSYSSIAEDLRRGVFSKRWADYVERAILNEEKIPQMDYWRLKSSIEGILKQDRAEFLRDCHELYEQSKLKRPKPLPS